MLQLAPTLAVRTKGDIHTADKLVVSRSAFPGICGQLPLESWRHQQQRPKELV